MEHLVCFLWGPSNPLVLKTDSLLASALSWFVAVGLSYGWGPVSTTVPCDQGQPCSWPPSQKSTRALSITHELQSLGLALTPALWIPHGCLHLCLLIDISWNLWNIDLKVKNRMVVCGWGWGCKSVGGSPSWSRGWRGAVLPATAEYRESIILHITSLRRDQSSKCKAWFPLNAYCFAPWQSQRGASETLVYQGLSAVGAWLAFPGLSAPCPVCMAWGARPFHISLSIT